MISLKNVNKSYGKKEIFKNLNVDFNDKGSITAILGESGSGKTTLLNLLFGIDQNFTGDFLLNNKNVKDFSSSDWDSVRNNTMQIVYQDFKLIEEFTVYNNLLYAINKNSESDEERIKESLKIMDLLEVINLPVKNISGGQKQRLALCRAVINNPKILLLDEPTGNLDDKNTENILTYIEKFKEKDIIVLIITHDNRILESVDYIYKLEEYTLKLQETVKGVSDTPKDKNIKKGNEVVEKDIPVRKQPILKFMGSNIKASKKDVFYTYIPMFFIFCIFVLLINVFKGASTASLNEFFGGIDDKTIFIDIDQFKQSFKDELAEKGIQTLSDGKRIRFSEEDLKQIRNIDGVKRADFVVRDVISTADEDGYGLKQVLKKEDFDPVVKNNVSYSKFKEEQINFNFESLNMPYNYINNYNFDNIEVLYGDFPKNKLDVLIPDIYALSLSDTLGIKIDELVDKKISLDCVDNKILNPTLEQLKPFKREYVVSGIYNSNYKNVINASQNIYLKYSDDLLPLTKEEYETNYNHYINIILKDKNETTLNYVNGIYENIDTYKKAYGSGYGQIIIEVNESKDLKEVTKQLDELLPVYTKLSQYDIKSGEASNVYKILNFTFVAVMTVVSLVFGIIIAFMNKSVMVKRNKRMSILYSLGYSRKKVMGIILSEIFILSFITVTFSILLVYLLNYFILQYTAQYKLFSEILSFDNLMYVYIFIFVMVSVSAIWSLFGVNKKNLKKYLEIG